MNQLLLHGSHAQIDGALIPHLSFHGVPLIYATSDINYAIVRCGQFDDAPLIREDYKDGHYHLCELEPGAFKKVFQCDGWIYVLKNDGFQLVSDMGLKGMDNEYASTTFHEYLLKAYVPNVWEEILKRKEYYDLIRYEDTNEEYWSHVTGGRKGYMERRLKRIEEINYAKN